MPSSFPLRQFCVVCVTIALQPHSPHCSMASVFPLQYFYCKLSPALHWECTASAFLLLFSPLIKSSTSFPCSAILESPDLQLLCVFLPGGVWRFWQVLISDQNKGKGLGAWGYLRIFGEYFLCRLLCKKQQFGYI